MARSSAATFAVVIALFFNAYFLYANVTFSSKRGSSAPVERLQSLSSHNLRSSILTNSPVPEVGVANAVNGEHCLPDSPTDWLAQNKCCTPNSPPFLETAYRHGTDKVTSHNYYILYQIYLAPLRCRSDLRFLEIGLGCGMFTGEGRSLTLWMDYFPHAAVIVEVEYNGECMGKFAQRWQNEPAPWAKTTPTSWAEALKRVRFEQGDQTSMESMNRIGDAHGPFDVVIDDGGHTMKQQIMSIALLWKYVKPGGVLIVEDLKTNFLLREYPQYSDFPITSWAYISQLQEALTDPRRAEGLDPAKFVAFDQVIKSLHSVHCSPEACALLKKPVGSQ
jgi:hypothetical protein